MQPLPKRLPRKPRKATRLGEQARPNLVVRGGALHPRHRRHQIVLGPILLRALACVNASIELRLHQRQVVPPPRLYQRRSDRRLPLSLAQP